MQGLKLSSLALGAQQAAGFRLDATPNGVILLDAALSVYGDDPPTTPAADGDAVEAWTDRISDRTFTDSGTAPMWRASPPRIDYQGGTENVVNALGGALTSSTSHTLLWWIDVKGSIGNDQIVRTTTGSLIVYLSQAGTMKVYDGSFRDSTAAPATGLQLLELQLDGSGGTGRFYRDGGAVGSAFTYTPQQLGSSTLQVGAGSGVLNAELRRFLWCDAILSGSDLTNVREAMQQ